MATLLQPEMLPDPLLRNRPQARVDESQGFKRSTEDVVVADLEPLVEDGGVVGAVVDGVSEVPRLSSEVRSGDSPYRPPRTGLPIMRWAAAVP